MRSWGGGRVAGRWGGKCWLMAIGRRLVARKTLMGAHLATPHLHISGDVDDAITCLKFKLGATCQRSLVTSHLQSPLEQSPDAGRFRSAGLAKATLATSVARNRHHSFFFLSSLLFLYDFVFQILIHGIESDQQSASVPECGIRNAESGMRNPESAWRWH